jgi:hypothetical protein
MAANIEVAQQTEAPGAAISRVPGGTWQPRPASRQRDAILIVILLAAAARSARLAEAAGAQISRVPGGLQPRPASRQRDAILIVILLSAAANLAANLAPVALFAIVLAASRGLVRDSQVIPRALTWYFGSVPAWVRRRRNRRYLRQQMLDAATG